MRTVKKVANLKTQKCLAYSKSKKEETEVYLTSVEGFDAIQGLDPDIVVLEVLEETLEEYEFTMGPAEFFYYAKRLPVKKEDKTGTV